MTELEFTAAALDAPESLELIEAVQQEYVVRYGGRDVTELAVAEFAPPQGIFVIGRDARQPVACGGLRLVARTLGATRLRLETGLHQPEALALYASAGYAEAEPFGHYAGAPLARHLANNLTDSGVPRR